MSYRTSSAARADEGNYRFVVGQAQGASRTFASTGASCSNLEVVTGDVTLDAAEAIVSPADGGLVDRAVRQAAGPRLNDALTVAMRELPGGSLAPGQAVMTPSFRLPSTFVIHCGLPLQAADPWKGRLMLAACYREALRFAREWGLSSLAFPALGTGAHGYPLAEAPQVALRTVVDELELEGGPPVVRFVLSRHAAFDAYIRAASARLESRF